MRDPANPFTDPGQVRRHLYVSAGRLARRSSALHRARVRGRHAAEVIADLVAGAAVTSAPVIADIGCGRGTTTCLLAGRLPQARIIATDLSAALLTTVRNRLPAAARAGAARADFHRLPIRDGACDLAVAAFCLYHSRSPGQVIGEIARCLAQGATAVIAVKSEDSYRELDLLMAASGLDPTRPTGQACTRPPTAATSSTLPPPALTSARSSTTPTRSPSRHSPTSPNTWLPHPSTSYPPPSPAPRPRWQTNCVGACPTSRSR
jgi:SAM-dependent methyltransferase